MEAAANAALNDKERNLLDSKLAAFASASEHYSLRELKEIAAQKNLWGEYWEFPEHLGACPVCLDFFETLQTNGEEADEQVLRRMRKIGRQRLLRFTPWLLKAAAVFVVGSLATWLLIQQISNPTVKVVEGAFELADGSMRENGSVAPNGSELNSTRETSALFSDGSKLLAAKDTQLSFTCERFGGNLVQMLAGSITCEVSKQKRGRSFRVLTPAGEITVVGTKFSVKSNFNGNESGQRKEGGLSFLHPSELGVKKDWLAEARSGNVVTVRVEEGAVRVKNRHGCEVLLKPGQTGVLRSELSVIDIFDGAKQP